MKFFTDLFARFRRPGSTVARARIVDGPAAGQDWPRLGWLHRKVKEVIQERLIKGWLSRRLFAELSKVGLLVGVSTNGAESTTGYIVGLLVWATDWLFSWQARRHLELEGKAHQASAQALTDQFKPKPKPPEPCCGGRC